MVLEDNLDTGWEVAEYVDILSPSISTAAWDGKEYFLLHHQSRIPPLETPEAGSVGVLFTCLPFPAHL